MIPTPKLLALQLSIERPIFWKSTLTCHASQRSPVWSGPANEGQPDVLPVCCIVGNTANSH
jgi:hypothetical protein